MKVADAKLAEIWDRGYTVVENFIDKETLEAAREALWTIHPKPEDYFAEPDKYPKYAKSQFAGIHLFPFPAWALNRLAVYPDLIHAAERFCGVDDIEIYKVELWAKYAGAINDDQRHHRDFGNHTLVVPRADGAHVQMTTFILLSDVTELDGPTKIIPLSKSQDIPLIPRQQPLDALVDREVSITGPAGSLLVYKTDVLHRGLDFHSPRPLALRLSGGLPGSWLAVERQDELA